MPFRRDAVNPGGEYIMYNECTVVLFRREAVNRGGNVIQTAALLLKAPESSWVEGLEHSF